MRKSRLAMFAFLLLLAVAGCKQANKQADIVFKNGKVYTVNEKQPWAEAIAIEGNSIAFVGSNADADKLVGADTKVEDLGGKFVMPGIISTHEHSIFLMAVKSGLVMKVTQDKKKMLAEVASYLKTHPEGPFFAYGGAYENMVKIHRKELDAVTGGKPFFIMAATGHGGWANTAALKNAGVTRDKEPIDFFGKDPDGTRNGYVGTAAAAFYMMGVGGLSKDAVLKSSGEVLEMIARNGVTHLMEAGQTPGHEEPLFDAIGQLEAEGKLTARYTVACMVQRPKHIPGAIECLKKFHKKYHSDFFNVNTLKIHGDGSFEGHTAYLLQPYSDKPGEHGILSVPEEQSQEAVLEVARLGFDIHTHAIGDAANRSFLNVFQKVREAGLNDVRLTMGHTVLVDDADLDRFKQLNVIANYYTEEAAQPNPGYLEKLGPERYKRLMRLGTMVKKGIRVTLSADYPSMPLNPFPHIHAAVTRSHVGEKEMLGPESEKLTVAEAIKAYTLDAAYQVRAEDYSGSLEVGKRADFIVLDRNLFEIPADDIVNTIVLKTVVDGRTVFDRAKEDNALDLVKVKVTNPYLQSAIDINHLNLLVLDELQGFSVCNEDDKEYLKADAGSQFAPDEVNKAFAVLAKQGYDYASPARGVYWKNTDSTYWIQWTLKDDAAILWAYDPETRKAVEILQVREK